LEETGVMSALRQVVEYSFDLVRLSPVLSSVFFCPEEYGPSSEGVNNAGVLQFVKVNEGDKYQRVRRSFQNLVTKLAVQFDADRPAAVSAFGVNFTGKKGVSESPLHEGRRNRVRRSGGVYFLAGMEFDSMGSPIRGYRECPSDRSLRIPEQKS
jgi:hypothetical protein